MNGKTKNRIEVLQFHAYTTTGKREDKDNNTHVGSPCSRTKIYVASVSHSADDAHRHPLHSFAAAAGAAPGTDRRTDGRARHSFNTLTYVVRVMMVWAF